MGRKRIKKMHRGPLAQDWAAALLASPTSNGRSHWEMLQAIKGALSAEVAAAKAELDKNPLTATVAAAAARIDGRRGDASISVDPDGSVVLEVKYREVADEAADADGRKWHTTLPSLEALRKEATTINVDISHMGRSKRKIALAIEAARAAKTLKVADETTPPPAPRKMMKTTSPVPVYPVTLPTDKGGLPFGKASELPEDLLATAPAPVPPVAPVIPAPPTKDFGDMEKIIKEGEGIDIDAILGEVDK